MEVAHGNEQNPSSTVAAESSAPASVTPSPAPTPTVAESNPGLNQESSVPSYTPNFKFKVMDKEHEIPESFRSIIKDADSEKAAREIFEKAFGLDHVKADRDTIRGKFNEYRQANEPFLQTYNTARDFYTRAIAAERQGNNRQAMHLMQEAFGTLGLTDQVLQKYVYHRLNHKDLSPEQQKDYNDYRELERQAWTSQQQLAQYQDQLRQLSVQTRTNELNQVLSQPGIAEHVQSFDQRNGPGAFINEVVMRGQYYAQAMGEDKSADAIVKELLTKYGMSQSQTPQQAAAPGQPAVVPAAKPVIPTVAGSGNPIKRKIASLDDLEKEYQNLK